MAWQSEMNTIVRYLVDDTDSSNFTFSDERVETTILVAAQLVRKELDFNSDYTINIDGTTITPDPTDDPRDENFVNLVSLKAACIILNSQYKTNSLNAVKVIDGPSTIDMTKAADGLKAAADSICEQYEKAKKAHQLGGVVGQAILTPYSPGSDYAYSSYPYGERGSLF